MAKPKKMTNRAIEAVVKNAIEQAKNHVDAEIKPDRLTAMKYFNGDTDLGVEEGRSKVVDTVVRDAVQSVKPVLMRVFMQAEKPAEYVPTGQAHVQGAEQATDYAQWKFEQAGGYSLLSGAFHDALTQKTGIVKAYWDEASELDIEEYSNLTEQELTLVIQQSQASGDKVSVLEHSVREEMMPGQQGLAPIQLHDAKLSIERTSGSIRLDVVAPERFFWDDGATSENDFYVLGHSEDVRVSDLVEMGFDFDEVAELGKEGEDETEYERQNYTDNENEHANDPSMKEVTLTECYMRMDVEGTGVARLYKFLCGGAKYTLLDHELADDVPFAVYQVDPLPHTFAGQSLADPVVEDQNTGTSLLRALIDGLHIANNPKTFYRSDAVDVDALLNNEYGALIECRDPQTDVVEAAAPNTATASLPALQYNNQRIAEKTGVSEAALGTNGDLLQAGATVAGVHAAVQGAQARVEYMARNLAEGHSRLFKLLLRLIRKHVEPGEFMRLKGQFIPVDPSGWSADMDVQTNVGLGTGQKAERAAALQNLISTQAQILQGYGLQNGLVTLTNFRNAQEDLAALGGLHNMDRYMAPMDPQREAALVQQQAQMAQQQQGSDPNAGIVAAEQIRAQAKVQSDQTNAQIKAQSEAMRDDRERDKTEQQAILELAKIGHPDPISGAAQIRQLQAVPRQG